MDQDTFWELIEGARRHSPDPDARHALLRDRLARLPAAEIAGFQICQDRTRERSDTWGLWGAAAQIFDGFCSTDTFWYFQPWLIGLGRDTFERATADPDALADVPEVQRLAWFSMRDWPEAHWPGWESFNYLAYAAYDQVTGEQEGLFDALELRGHTTPQDPSPTGERWDFDDPDELSHRLPRLGALFPLDCRDRTTAERRAAFDTLLAEDGQSEDEFLTALGIQWVA